MVNTQGHGLHWSQLKGGHGTAGVPASGDVWTLEAAALGFEDWQQLEGSVLFQTEPESARDEEQRSVLR